eukprot:1302650-Alexandrium_andersonii.AAC.1
MRRLLPSAGRPSACSRSSARSPWPPASGRRTRSRRSTRRGASARPPPTSPSARRVRRPPRLVSP